MNNAITSCDPNHVFLSVHVQKETENKKPETERDGEGLLFGIFRSFFVLPVIVKVNRGEICIDMGTWMNYALEPDR